MFGSLEYGIPAMLIVLLAVPRVSAAIMMVSLAGLARAWRRMPWSFAKMQLAATMIAALAFVPWLAYWNLLGFRF